MNIIEKEHNAQEEHQNIQFGTVFRTPDGLFIKTQIDQGITSVNLKDGEALVFEPEDLVTVMTAHLHVEERAS